MKGMGSHENPGIHKGDSLRIENRHFEASAEVLVRYIGLQSRLS